MCKGMSRLCRPWSDRSAKGTAAGCSARASLGNSEGLGATQAEQREQCRLLRYIFGPSPFRPLPALDPSWLTWKNGTIRHTAEDIYADGAFERLPPPCRRLDGCRLCG